MKKELTLKTKNSQCNLEENNHHWNKNRNQKLTFATVLHKKPP